MPSSVEDVAFLSRSEHRVGVLDELAAGACDRDALRAATGASAPTLGRILGDFESRGWVARDGREYALTAPGAYVAEHFSTLLDRLDVERTFRDVWPWLPGDLPGFSLDLVADAVVTTVEPGDPYAPATRCGSLFREASRVRVVDAGLTAPHHFAELYQRIVDGMETELVIPSRVAARISETYPDAAAAVSESDNFTLWLDDALPSYRITVFDRRVGVGGYDPTSGVLRVYVDGASPELRAWADSAFEAFRREARPARPRRTLR